MDTIAKVRKQHIRIWLILTESKFSTHMEYVRDWWGWGVVRTVLGSIERQRTSPKSVSSTLRIVPNVNKRFIKHVHLIRTWLVGWGVAPKARYRARCQPVHVETDPSL
jgi:hypothetical protein